MRQEFDKAKLVALIQAGDLKSAKVAIMGIYEHHAAEMACFGVFESGENPPTELIEAALQKFMDTHEDCTYRPNHGYWVHSLSHFMDILWDRGLTDWIKKFNKVSFEGAIQFCDSNCSSRLVANFVEYSGWDADPSEFGMTPNSTSWLTSQYDSYAIARIAAGKFVTEESYLRWKLVNDKFAKFDNDTQREMVDADGLAAVIKRIKELGGDVSEYGNMAESRLKKQLAEIENCLSNPTKDFMREKQWVAYYNKGVEKTKAALTTIANQS